ncbi:beta-glucuronidase [Dictyoglomus thermophilum]|uniref:beta-glucuronidase n=1 Tax=Dictyoglomus thermophilum TaxID=14 RepID=UPI0011EAF3BE|nr:beta-glucuronidase [Dictyoglomus thermophilum]TYT24333.1 beta-glucuronidase [Dictyoglomus thermophilum]
MLYPKITLSRIVYDLSGIWNFRESNSYEVNIDFCIKKITDAYPIYVPSSYNDLRSDKNLRYHNGLVYYQKEFYIPEFFKDKRIVLRFEAVNNSSIVYLNGSLLRENKGGFLPFEVEIHEYINYGKSNLLTVVVSNDINYSTLPVGDESGYGLINIGDLPLDVEKRRNVPNFDFFNYAGIIRPVKIYTTPKEYIKDITIVPHIISEDSSLIEYDVEIEGDGEIILEVYSEEGDLIGKSTGRTGEILIKNPHLWEPGNPYLYTAKIIFKEDIYEETFGIRTIEVSGEQFLINGKPFYFKGFGRHEDSIYRGRGLDEAVNLKDISLLKWIGANSIRTSHYPYSEEMLYLCDREGIVVIAEAPAVGLNLNIKQHNEKVDTYSVLKTYDHHKEVLKNMIKRDKNHPCIVMWCIANEPDTTSFPNSAYNYFKPLYDLVHNYDPQKRPVTITSILGGDITKDKIIKEMDVISLNRYYGWYIASGDLDKAKKLLEKELEYWAKFGKPVLITEFGADTIIGLHSIPPVMFSEEYQIEVLKANQEIFDKYRFIIGEHVWTFADFQTEENLIRIDGNKKGVFTRDRRPKMSAYYLKKRWESIPNFNYKK